MTFILAKYDGDKSFPSHDALSAAIVAIPLYGIQGCEGLALAIVVTACLGRMYVLAHHFFDVLTGCLLAIGAHVAATALGFKMHHLDWFHALVAMANFVAIDRMRHN